MALFGRDYDREYGYRGTWDRDRGYAAGSPGYGYGGSSWGGYDRGYGFTGDAYDRGYKSRTQTDFGDPFGDRTSRTPMRMIHGEFRGYDRGFRGYDRGFRGYDRGFRGYDTGYTGGGLGRTGRYGANPMGYEPYEGRGDWNRGAGWNRGTERGYGARGGGYDRGWF